MRVTRQGLISFADSLPERCKNQRDKILKKSEGNWDTRIRKSFAEFASFWFCEAFELSPAESRDYFYVEGWNSIPDSMRGGAFFGTRMHPDAALILKDKLSIAIELDHGAKGSQVRNALAKAGFSVILGGFDRAILLFFWDQENMGYDLETKGVEAIVLKEFRERFRTTLYLV